MSNNFNEFLRKFTGHLALSVKTSEKIFDNACKELYNRTKERTPIGNPDLWEPPVWPKGYTPGSLKASWTIEKSGLTTTIANPQPYAYLVETGWSYKQRPEGMLRVSLVEFPDLIDNITSKEHL